MLWNRARSSGIAALLRHGAGDRGARNHPLPEIAALDADPYPLDVDPYALDCHRKAGRIASECREWAKANIKPGVSIRYVLETVEDTIRERGAAPGFPAQSS